MNTYLIPIVNEQNFLKKVNKYVAKSNGMIKVIPGEKIHVDLDDGTGRTYACRKYEVEGTYQLNGWEFVGEIEHKENGNVFRIINEKHQGKVIKLYENAIAKCDHCGVVRFRRNTFIVYNTSKNEYKQVGKSCLQEYTGFDVEKCALLSSFLKDIEGFMTFHSDNDSSIYYNQDIIRKVIYQEVVSNGYDKINSKYIVNDIYTNKELRTEIYNNVDDSVIEKISQWLDEKTQKPNEYYSSCKVIWESSNIEFRDFNYLLSMINLYLKDMNQKASKMTVNEYVGNIGDKIEIIVKSRRVLFTRGPYATNGSVQDVYEIIGADGHTYIWATSTYVEECDVIKATIKEHKEYKGIKQTIITRGTIINNLKKEYKKIINNETQESVWKVLEEYC